MEPGGPPPAHKVPVPTPSTELAPTHRCTWVSVLRETDTDGQASGGSDSGDWIFTIREKDPKSLENGALQPSDLERNKMKDIPKRSFSQCLSTIISPLFAELKEKSQACGGNLGSIEELRGAIYLAEEACPGISDTMVAQLVQRLQRYSLSGGGTSSH